MLRRGCARDFGISIHALREEGDEAIRSRTLGKSISIHALREEGDRRRPPRQSPVTHFYPRPPRGGRRVNPEKVIALFEFLSTPSARRATECPDVLSVAFLISIHALREEGDRSGRCSSAYIAYFYPRPPRGGRPATLAANPYVLAFLSTPSARRATIRFRPVSTTHCNFYPRPPRGGRPRSPVPRRA